MKRSKGNMVKGDRVGLQLRAVHSGRAGSAGRSETFSGLRTNSRRAFLGRARVLALGIAAVLVAVIAASFTFIPAVWAELVPPPPSLKMVPVPEPPNLLDFVQDKQAAIRLGKALFWDMQLGSDGAVACATCHFQAGADVRTKNQMNFGGDSAFQVGGPNSTLTQADFPFHQRRDPVDQQASTVLRDTDDRVGSQGVRLAQFVDISGGAVDTCTPADDAVFNVGGAEVRRVTGRNAPSAINAVFNFANFQDGRANNIFNGVNPFGASDLDGKVFQNSGSLAAVQVRISNASLASQAVGPPLSDVEMSCAGRTFPKLGKKMLSLTPLGSQLVHPSDSVLGSLAKASLDGNGRATGNPGLSTTYTGLIQAAFQSKWWNNTGQIIKFQGGVPSILANPGRVLLTDEFIQMEANFSLFFGLAVQLYEATLVSDDTLFDRVQEGRAAFTAKQQQGLTTFLGVGQCIACHGGPEFTNQSVRNQQELDHGVIERMFMAVGGEAIYDNGFYNIGTRPTNDDIGRGGTDGFGFPLSFSRLAEMKARGELPAGLASFVPALPVGV
ncbi:MAG: cytochrome c peroxidase, partial [Dehalococcoidia bacterium]|nr:cytochrome c peroxidase [Dehalococcoidia bacterium]